MLAPSAVQALCPWVIRVQRPVSLETNLSCSVPNTFTQCITLKRISKKEKCCAPQICHCQSRRSCYPKSRCHGQIKAVRRTHQKEVLVTLSRIPLHSRHKGLYHLVKVIIKRDQRKNTGYRVHFISKELYVLHALA